jgi:hypothetical protein
MCLVTADVNGLALAAIVLAATRRGSVVFYAARPDRNTRGKDLMDG